MPYTVWLQLCWTMSNALWHSAKRLPVVKVKASVVLTNYLEQSKEPPWTSFFVKYSSVIDDQRGRSHFNWKAGSTNYHVLRAGCFPYIKYHCTKRPYENLENEDKLFSILKLVNLGKPLASYVKDWLKILVKIVQKIICFHFFFFFLFLYYW